MNPLSGHCSPRLTLPCFGRHGFTLIEVLAVVAITAIMAGGASLTLLHARDAVTLDDVVRRITYLDAITRHAARRSGNRYTIAFDIKAGTITSRRAVDGSAESDIITADVNGTDDSTVVQHMQMPRDCRLDHLWIAGQDDLSASPNIVAVSSDGYTPTYTLQIGGPGGKKRWVILAGLTGQACLVGDAGQVRSLFKLLLPAGETNAR